MTEDLARKTKFARIILGYPFALIAIAVAINLVGFGVAPLDIALPQPVVLGALVVSVVLLLANHTWLMTSTELTRLRYNLHATPEEWAASDHQKADASPEALQELDRRHRAHMNATENMVYFVALAALICFVTPNVLAAQLWFLAFALGRLAHTFFYLNGNAGGRGIAMSLALTALYGLASYLVLSLII